VFVGEWQESLKLNTTKQNKRKQHRLQLRETGHGKVVIYDGGGEEEEEERKKEG